MERHEEQQGTQPDAGQGQPDLAKRIAEYERTMQAARESIEQLRKQAEEAARAPQEEAEKPEAQAAGEGEEKPAEEPRGEEPNKEEKQETAAQPVGTEEDQQPEAVGEMEENQPEEQAQAEEPEEARETAEAEEPEGEEEAEPAEEERGGAEVLFDGSAESMNVWKKVGAGDLKYKDGQAHLKAGRDRGLVYAVGKRFGDFRLKAQYRLDRPEAPMGLAVRFQDPEKPVADRENPEKKFNYDNQAYVAAHTGFEVSLGTAAAGKPGTFVGIPVGDEPGQQRQPEQAQLATDDWNEVEVEVRGNDYTVRLNGEETAHFTNTDDWRGKPASADEEAGFVGFLLGEEPHPGREAKPARKTGALPPQMAGPLLPGGRVAGRRAAAPEKETPAVELILRRVEVEKLEGAAAMTPEERKKLGKKSLEALHQEVIGALAKIKSKDQGLEAALEKAYGYAILPAVGRANLVLGIARGYGEVFEQGKPAGFTKLTQLNLGVQVGGQTFIELLIFGTKESLDAFKASPVVFNANAAAAFVRGAAGTANFRDVTAHSYSQGGMVLELSLGGQKFRYLPEPEAIEALAKSAETRSKIAKFGQSAANLGKRIGATSADLGKKIAAVAGGSALGKKIAAKTKGNGLGKKIAAKGNGLGKKISEKTAGSGLGKKISAKAGGLLQRHRPH